MGSAPLWLPGTGAEGVGLFGPVCVWGSDSDRLTPFGRRTPFGQGSGVTPAQHDDEGSAPPPPWAPGSGAEGVGAALPSGGSVPSRAVPGPVARRVGTVAGNRKRDAFETRQKETNSQFQTKLVFFLPFSITI